ncbi:MAG: methyltransferase protein [Thelocarpon superellum]|nr:MAG: methyltransferase protein [Thelocarpon superellum]
MASSPPHDEQTTTFFVGQHETKRVLPVTGAMLRQAQDSGYDMLTTPVTTPHYHSRVLALLSSHLSQLGGVGNGASKKPSAAPKFPTPVIPPLNPVDTPLSPSSTISQLLAVAAPWTDLCSPDPLIADLSRQVLRQEVAYAAFCGIGNIILPAPKLHHRDVHGRGLTQYGRAVQESLVAGPYLAITMLLPMTDHPDTDPVEGVGNLAPFAREDFVEEAEGQEGRRADIFGTWDGWNLIRTVCNYSPRLFVGLSIPRHLPPIAVQSRWFSEPLRLMALDSTTFLRNKNHYPVLGKSHQALVARYMRLRNSPWILLCDVGPIPHSTGAGDDASTPVDGYHSSTGSGDTSGGTPTPSPKLALVETNRSTLAEAAAAATAAARASRRSSTASPFEDPQAQAHIYARGGTPISATKPRKDPTPHLSYIRFLSRSQPAHTTIERFGAGYQDYLQAPLQPLTDNLESITYEVFEKDPVKYDWYERAMAAALSDFDDQKLKGSGPNGKIVVAVVGAGRGPLVNRALRASLAAGVNMELWAVEKNPNAFVLLQRHNESDWGGRVKVVKSDMRSWKGPPLRPQPAVDVDDPYEKNGVDGGFGRVDIMVSELLGSFGDNELSPECLDGVQHVLHPEHGISIPASYTAHLTPVAAPRLHTTISSRVAADPTAPETPYVVMLHAIDYLSTAPVHPTAFSPTTASTSSPALPLPLVQQAWEFAHPNPILSTPHTDSLASNAHNTRFAHLRFPCAARGSCNGVAGYFETVLYSHVELSTRPDTMDAKSADMISWFPIYFPLKTPLYFPDSSELDISIWRQTDDRKVWYEWMVEAFVVVDEHRIRLGSSELHSSKKNGCLR